MLNVLDRLPKKIQPKSKRQLQDMVYSESRQEAEEKRDLFVYWCQRESCHRAGETLIRDWERMVTFYRFPKEHWRHLQTTNVVESPFAVLKLRTDAAKRDRKVENATALIWKMLMVAEHRFRRLNTPEKLKLVHLGIDSQESLEAEREEVLAVV